MGTLATRPKTAAWATRSVGATWRVYDLQLTTYAVLLAAIGLAMAYSNSVEAGHSVFEVGSTFVRGILWAAIALVVFAVATAFDYRWLRTLAWLLYALEIGLLALTLAVGSGIGESARWVTIAGLQFQFSEIAKILMVLTLASYLASRSGDLNGPIPILTACLLVAPPLALVVLQPDLGTSLVFVSILAGMLFMSGASLRWLGLMAAGALGSLPILWNYVLLDYQKTRLIEFLNPTPDIQGSGWQLFQSQIAVGSGGWLGKGLTNGTQNQLDFLPVQTTDFVFSILAEELGFLGCVVVLVLFGALLWRILVAGWRSRDPFGTLFAAGVGSMILFQVIVNVGMVIGVMPITGIPLPFVTHGGASLISLAAGLGILQSINIRQGRAEW
jgi:rod shape determining protein RodA